MFVVHGIFQNQSNCFNWKMLRKLSQSLEVSQRKLNDFGKSFYEMYITFFISYNISICNIFYIPGK